MGGFGDLLGGLAEALFGAAGEAGMERAGESVVEAGLGALGIGEDGRAEAPDGAVDRYLAGAPRALGINDI